MIAGPRALAHGHLAARLTLRPAELVELRELLAVASGLPRQWVATDASYPADFRGTLHGVDVYTSTDAEPVDVLELVAALGGLR